jgi:cobalt-zinc-cadmium efflux system membrane fusion protein
MMAVPIKRWLHTALSYLPNLAILGALAGLAFVGVRTDWKLSRVSELWKPPGDVSDAKDTKDDTDKKKNGEASSVRFASKEAIEKSGIKTAPITRRPISEALVANGTIEYDRTRMAHLSSRVPGHVWKVYKHVGAPVRKGDVLGLVDAADVGRAKAEFLQALRVLELKEQTLERTKQLDTTGAAPERQLREAAAAVAEARIRLFTTQQALSNLGLPIRSEQVAGLSDERLTQYVRFLGLPEPLTRTFDPATTTANLVPLLAPFDGVVIRSDMVEGEAASTTQPQFIVADVRNMWIMLDVRQEDISRVRDRHRVTFRPDGLADFEAVGQVSWISTEVDDKTRTVRVRVEVENPLGQLRARSFGTGRILVVEKPDVVTVPAEAIQWDNSYAFVFVRQGDELSFERREVRLGIRNHDYVEVLDGVLPGEIVATTGSHVLKSEFFKCCRS